MKNLFLIFMLGIASYTYSQSLDYVVERKGKEDGLILPTEVAETYYYLSQQHRSSWTHEIDIRSFSDKAWWN